MFNAISDLYPPDARSNMSPSCDYQNWLQIWPNVFLGNEIKTWTRSTIFKTFLLLVSLSLHAIDVLPRDQMSALQHQMNWTDRHMTLQTFVCASRAEIEIHLEWRTLAHPSGSSSSIYQYHNRVCPCSISFPPPTETIIYAVTFWSHFLQKLERKSSPYIHPHLIHHLDSYLNNMNLKQVSTSNVQH